MSSCSDTLVMNESRTWANRTLSLTSEMITTTNRSFSLPTMTFSQLGLDTVAGLTGLDCPTNACFAISRVVGLPAFGAAVDAGAVVVVRSNCFFPP